MTTMKRSFPNERARQTSRPSTTNPFRPPVQNSFRFQNESNFAHVNIRNRTVDSRINNIRSVHTRQIRPAAVRMNTSVPWFQNLAFQLNRFNLLRNPTPFVPDPRYFAVRNPVSMPRVQRTNYRFQEPYRISINPSSCRPRSAQFRQNTNFFMNRKWQVVPEQGSSSSNDFCFSLVSYNVLSDELLYENKYLYQDCDDGTLEWTFRKENLMKEILGYNADILCLQEIDEVHYEDWFKPQLESAGYQGVYNKRSGDRPDGCATFYRTSKFTLVQKKLVKYNTAGFPILNKDNVGIVVLLKPNLQKPTQNEPHLCVANTHLLFNTKRGDIKLAQLAYLFAEVDSVAKVSTDAQNTVYYPVILCGDLNSLPFSPLHYFLTTGQLDYSIRAAVVISGQLRPSQITAGPSSRLIQPPLLPWELGLTLDCQWRTGEEIEDEKHKHNNTTVLTIPFQLQSVYKHIEDGLTEVTTCHLKACCNVDYIFYTPGTKTICRNTKSCTHSGKLTLLGKLQLPGKSDFVKQLPNRHFSSDHIALKASFKLTL